MIFLLSLLFIQSFYDYNDSTLIERMKAMIKITEYEGQKINDQFGILSGDRYEYNLYLDVPEDDELHLENGVYARVLFKVEDQNKEIIKYDLVDRTEGKILDFELEDEEIQLLEDFCLKHYQEIE